MVGGRGSQRDRQNKVHHKAFEYISILCTHTMDYINYIRKEKEELIHGETLQYRIVTTVVESESFIIAALGKALNRNNNALVWESHWE